MNIVIFEDKDTKALYPLTLTRPASFLRIGIQKIYQKWERLTNEKPSHFILNYLKEEYDDTSQVLLQQTNLYVNSRIVPDKGFLEILSNLKENHALVHNNTIIAYKGKIEIPENKEFFDRDFLPKNTHIINIKNGFLLLNRPYDIFLYNSECIEIDFIDIVKQKQLSGIKSQPISDPYTKVYDNGYIFIEEGAEIRSAIINPNGGFIYIGRNAQIQEGSIIFGNHAICDNAVINIGAKLRGDSTIGEFCKVGGEISNSVFIGYSNKAHDGFLGNAVIGMWCNIGANTTASNLKNNYSKVRLYDYRTHKYEQTNLLFCGPIIGDHTKIGIQTMLNTATVIGVSVNLFGSEFPPKFIPSFSWGGPTFGWREMILKKAFETASAMMKRRNKTLSQCEKNILTKVFEIEKPLRDKLIKKNA